MKTVHALPCGALLLAAAAVAIAGDLNPPSGAPSPTMKTLAQVEPRIPLSQATTPGDADSMLRITQPGSYYLTGDLIVTGDRSGIEIASHNVTIDLNGFTIIGTNLHNRSGITAGIIQLRNIHVRNGAVRDFLKAGVELHDNDDFERPRLGRIENIRAYNCGVGVGGGSQYLITDCVTALCPGGVITYGETQIERCFVSDSTGTGIMALTGPAVVRDCQVDGAADGVLVTQGLVEGVFVRIVSGDGIRVTASGVVRGCQVLSAGADAVDVGSSSVVENCRVQDFDVDGIRAGADSRIVGNHVYGSNASVPGTQTGILAFEGAAHIEGNSVHRVDVGVATSSAGGCFIAGNTFRSVGTPLLTLGTNTFGPLITSTGQISTTSPWANFSH